MSLFTPGRRGIIPFSTIFMNRSVFSRCSSLTSAWRCSLSAMLLKGSSLSCSCAVAGSVRINMPLLSRCMQLHDQVVPLLRGCHATEQLPTPVLPLHLPKAMLLLHIQLLVPDLPLLPLCLTAFCIRHFCSMSSMGGMPSLDDKALHYQRTQMPKLHFFGGTSVVQLHSQC